MGDLLKMLTAIWSLLLAVPLTSAQLISASRVHRPFVKFERFDRYIWPTSDHLSCDLLISISEILNLIKVLSCAG